MFFSGGGRRRSRPPRAPGTRDLATDFKFCSVRALLSNTEQSQSILNFASWLNDYSEKMKKYITDDRLYSAIRVLVSIYIERTSVGMRELIQGIIDFERNSPSYETSDQNLLVTSTPIDIFKIINEGLDLGYFVCKLKDMAISLAVQAKNLMSYYINEVFEDDSVLKINQLIAFCNNAIQFTKLIASYNERLNQECGLSEAECERFFDADKLKQSIIQLADTIYREIFTSIFSKIGASFAKKFFLDLNIEDILQDIVTKSHPIIKQLHDRFAKKIWKSFLENFVMLYLQTLILSCNKSKKGDVKIGACRPLLTLLLREPLEQNGLLQRHRAAFLSCMIAEADGGTGTCPRTRVAQGE